MALRRPFSFLLLLLALLGAGSGGHETAGASSSAAPIALRAADLAAPSPFLGAPALPDARSNRLAGTGPADRLPLRSLHRAGTDAVGSFASLEARVRATDTALLDITPFLIRARTGDRSAHSTSLPPPHTA